MFTIVIAGERLAPEALIALLLAWVGSLATNLYVVGPNRPTTWRSTVEQALPSAGLRGFFPEGQGLSWLPGCLHC
jgi:hypothetical protein